MPSGLEILQEAIETCKAVRDGLESVNEVSPGLAPTLDGIVNTLSGLSPSFFFKTMPSVPASRACQRAAVGLKETVDKADWTELPAGLEKLQVEIKILAEKATMKGTTLT
ncbi:MAG: hypothetical protein QF467_00060 [SAR202 cluster bacterium]|jgi:hypothetical protein|nr:hypothetical protein [SAR202 cluster bacterium]|tara:strand:- start:28 stop:357 length:330 start_codon:yes stop_codon:yes gene_type:complete